LAGGLAGIPAYVGFGNSAPGLVVLGNPIDLASGTGLANFAWTIPQDGTITAIAAQFTVIAAVSLSVGTVSVEAQLYRAPAGSSDFTELAGTTVTLNPPLSTIAIGTVVSGLENGLSVPVTAGDNLLLVFSASNNSPLSLVSAIQGYASAGLTIE
jgi:BclB C-terminal domain-containing protein